uniref:Uncharacterized protein n=1 Tax=Chromera velia CCMP2878 TaxID=1169474 RepID=A0A0G4HGT2_9ALVE|eukprot:Cvel_27439.t1-p1 / transcript=Cvel_27439.t1 / gene=Cvel_27439 / organism=Chromera_velia_CCMP2878 / gene_product=hypothetical protein / transcript_product=hypothetical protein / location=Cvel_scaffold3423:7011-11595(+) / protein_length=263 / sequence_SO=supercontig / SO=protein_coding / is_pseudo=false
MFMRNHSSPWHLFKSAFTDFVSVALELVLPPGSLRWAFGGDDGDTHRFLGAPDSRRRSPLSPGCTQYTFASSQLHTESKRPFCRPDPLRTPHSVAQAHVDGSKANVEPAKEPVKAGRRRNSITCSLRRSRVFPPEIPGLPIRDPRSSHRSFPSEMPGFLTPESPGLLAGDPESSPTRDPRSSPTRDPRSSPTRDPRSSPTRDPSSSHRRPWVVPLEIAPPAGILFLHRKYWAFLSEIPGLPTASRDSGTSDRRYQAFLSELSG